jgi:hypothetical protein
MVLLTWLCVGNQTVSFMILQIPSSSYREWLLHQSQALPVYLPRKKWTDSPPPRMGDGWWYSCRTDITFRTCRTCNQRYTRNYFSASMWQKRCQVRCLACQALKQPSERRDKLPDDAAYTPSVKKGKGGEETGWRLREESRLRKRRKIDNCEEGDEEEGDSNDSFEHSPVHGFILDPEEPDFLNYHDQEEGARVILTMEGVYEIILEQTNMIGEMAPATLNRVPVRTHMFDGSPRNKSIGP